MSRGLSFRFLTAAIAFGWACAAQAQESAPITTPHATVTLVSETAAVEADKPFRLGLHFRLAKGWHIYWTNPGAAGEPPELDLSLPEGAKASDISWPTPERVRQNDEVMSYAYVDEVLLPFTVTPPSGLPSFPIKTKASWLICEKICVPEEGALTLDLPVGRASPSIQAPLFAATDARIPKSSSDAAAITRDGVLTVTGDGLSPDAVREAWFLPASWGAIDDLAPQAMTVAPGKLSLSLKPGPAFDPKASLTGVLALKDAGGRERDLAIVATPVAGTASAAAADPSGSAPAPADTNRLSLFSALAFAFLGGLILNLMPCVFPILAVKAMSLASLAGRDRKIVRLHAASYILGVLIAFGALGAALIALRAAGASAGWGFQFQSPIFVAAVAWLLLAIGLNLSGVFEIGGGWVGVGEGLTHRDGLAGSFFTGLLAVVVASPCTAPFMGAALAAAATAAPATALLIFLALGLGLAAPYGVLALAPGLAVALPRPGRWMLILRQALAFPMYGAAVWLVWVVSQQAGADGGLLVLSGAVLIGFAAWIFGATRSDAKRGRAIGAAVATATALLALLTLDRLAVLPQDATASATAEGADGLHA